MIEEIGTVKSLEGDMAVVLIPRKSACEGCAAGVCKPESQTMEIEALNRVGAQVGQRVKVAVKPFTFVKGSIVVYGAPALALVIGAIIGKEWVSRLFTAADPDILSAICGFGALVVAFAGVKLWAQAASGKTASKPVIEEIVS
ncbi:MAG: SoxR reducing system RseC family protein [Nitrospiraceae bacterium]|nr:SoxR reducing system RseC family protein [Nitrospiraceae bacterium]